MNEIVYKKAFSEVYDIICNMDESLYKKIPCYVLEFLEKNRDKQYKVNIDYNIGINNQKLQKETRVILSLFYRMYLCKKGDIRGG